MGVRFVHTLRPTDIAQAVIELLREPDRAAELGARGPVHVMANYTRDHFRGRLLSTLGATPEPAGGPMTYQPRTSR
jgi:hypothetical protein